MAKRKKAGSEIIAMLLMLVAMFVAIPPLFFWGVDTLFAYFIEWTVWTHLAFWTLYIVFIMGRSNINYRTVNNEKVENYYEE